MSNENYSTISMVEKILSEIDNIIKTDSELQDFVIIPTDFNKNKNPVIHINHSLGLELWCIKHVYSYAYDKLLKARILLKENKIPKHKRIELNKFLIGVLLVQPDVATFWNLKRELVNGDVLAAKDELHFAKIVLSYKSKSNEAFAYRKWLLNRIVRSDNRSNNWEETVATELAVTEMAASKAANNYHAWTHRQWTLQRFLPFFPSTTNVVNSELDFSERWISFHVSEHAGFHYRQSLLGYLRAYRVQPKLKYNSFIPRYFTKLEGGDKCKVMLEIFGNPENNSLKVNDQLNIYKQLSVLFYDVNLLDDLIRMYPEHESIWYHRRFLFFHLLSALYEFHGCPLKPGSFAQLADRSFGQNVTDFVAENERMLIEEDSICNSGEKCSKMLKFESNVAEKSLFYSTILENERLFIERYCQSSEKERMFAKRHEKWLKCVLGIKFVSHSF